MVSMSGNGWYALLSILKESRDEQATLAAVGPLSCPNDGEPLIEGPDGVLFCKYDGWRPGNA